MCGTHHSSPSFLPLLPSWSHVPSAVIVFQAPPFSTLWRQQLSHPDTGDSGQSTDAATAAAGVLRGRRLRRARNWHANYGGRTQTAVAATTTSVARGRRLPARGCWPRGRGLLGSGIVQALGARCCDKQLGSSFFFLFHTKTFADVAWL